MKKNQDEIKKKLQQDLTKLQNEAEIKELQSKIDQLKMEQMKKKEQYEKQLKEIADKDAHEQNKK